MEQKQYAENKKIDNLGDIFRERTEDGLYKCLILMNVQGSGVEESVFWSAGPDDDYSMLSCSGKDCRDCLLGMTFAKLLYEDYHRPEEK